MLRILIWAISFSMLISCRSYNIQKIEFQTTACYGECPIFKMTVYNNKHGIYDALDFNKDSSGKEIRGTFTTKIDNYHYNEIQGFFNETDFVSLKDKYAVGYTDQQTGTLHITYDGGRTKIIKDYGLQGTFGLQRLYGKIFALRLNQNWH